MTWYKKYLAVYDKPFEEISKDIVTEIQEKIKNTRSDQPLVSVVAIAHNEEKHLASCLWSLCDNIYNFPIEIFVVNNNSTDKTTEVLQNLGVTYFNETQKGPGFARQNGLKNARGKYYMCIDADTMYPPHYIQTMITPLKEENIVATYGLWSFIPDKQHSKIGLILYEFLRDIYLKIQNIKRPELCVRGMAFAFKTKNALKYNFRTDILRGEDGYMAYQLKLDGIIKFITSSRTRVLTGNNTLNADGSFFNSFKNRMFKGVRNFGGLFFIKKNYDDKESNKIK